MPGTGPKEPQGFPSHRGCLGLCLAVAPKGGGLHPFQFAEIVVEGRQQKSPACSPPFKLSPPPTWAWALSALGPEIFPCFLSPLIPYIQPLTMLIGSVVTAWVATAVSCLALLTSFPVSSLASLDGSIPERFSAHLTCVRSHMRHRGQS